MAVGFLICFFLVCLWLFVSNRRHAGSGSNLFDGRTVNEVLDSLTDDDVAEVLVYMTIFRLSVKAQPKLVDTDELFTHPYKYPSDFLKERIASLDLLCHQHRRAWQAIGRELQGEER